MEFAPCGDHSLAAEVTAVNFHSLAALTAVGTCVLLCVSLSSVMTCVCRVYYNPRHFGHDMCFPVRWGGKRGGGSGLSLGQRISNVKRKIAAASGSLGKMWEALQ